MTPQQIERMLRYSPGRVVEVVKDAVTTYGHERGTPVSVLEGEGGSGGVQAKDWSVTIANGILAGISATEGIDAELTVGGVDAVVRGIGPADGEPDGDVITLRLGVA